MSKSLGENEKSFLGTFTTADRPILFDQIEAGNYLGGQGHALSPKTMEARRFRGLPPEFIKIGRLVRYDRRTLDSFIESQRRRSTSEAVEK